MSVVRPACDSLAPPNAAGVDFDALFATGYRRLTRLLFRITGDTGRAEEVASEAFWRLHAKPPAAGTNVEGWLYRTGVRLALDHLKKERRRARYEALAAVFGRAATPQQMLEQTEERARVRAVLSALKAEQVGLILLRAEGLSYAELSGAMGVKTSSVGTLLSRAEKAFRKEYVRRYGEPRTTSI